MFTKNYYYGLCTSIANQSSHSYGGFSLAESYVKTIGGISAETLLAKWDPNLQYENYVNFGVPLFEGIMSTGYLSNMIIPQVTNGINYSAPTSSNAYGFIFGTGNTPATVDDYWLSGDPVDPANYTYTLVRTPFVEGDNLTWSFIYTIVNTSDNPITIGEIGHFSNMGVYNGSRTYYYNVMTQRTAFESPITIEPDGVGQITFNITVPIPTT